MTKRKTHEDYVKEVYEKLGDRYVVESEYVWGKTRITFRHLDCNETFDRRADTLPKIKGCPYCNGNKKSHKQFVTEVEDKLGSDYEVLGEYVEYHTPVLMRHNSESCDNYEWHVEPASLLSSDSKCPKCSGKYQWTTDEFIEKVESLVRDEYTVIGEYSTALSEIKFRHNNEGCNFHKFSMRPNNFISQGQRCPSCRESKGERKIKDFLDSHGVAYVSNYTFDDCRYRRPLPFDFAIFINGVLTLVEFDGEQHYRASDHFGGEEKLRLVQKRDAIKNNYCATNNITLIRIPYWEFKNIKEVLIKIIRTEDDIIGKETVFNTV